MNTSLLQLLRCPLHPNGVPLHIITIKERSHTIAEEFHDTALECQQCGNIYPVIQGIPDMLIKNEHEESYLETETQQWDAHAKIYDEKRVIDPIYMAGVDAVVDSLYPQDGDLILDACCGTGLTTRKYQRDNLHIVAFDLSMRSLLYLKTILNNASIDFVRGNLNCLPFYDNTFDKVLCANAIQHIPKENVRKHCIQELSRVAKPRSRVIVSTHNLSVTKKRAGWPKEGPAGSHSGDIQYIYRYELKEFHPLLSSSLIVDRIIGAGLPYLPYRFKLSPLSRRLERFLRRFRASAFWGFMLVGICYKQ